MQTSECELCGKEISILKKAKIEGTIMDVCNNCSALGTVMPDLPVIAKPTTKLRTPSYELLDNYPTFIRNARQKQNLTIEQLALKLSEKDFVVRRVEEGKLKPDEKMAKKFERVLGIRIVVSGTVIRENLDHEIDKKDQKTNETKSSTDKLTLGDFIKIKKKKIS